MAGHVARQQKRVPISAPRHSGCTRFCETPLLSTSSSLGGRLSWGDEGTGRTGEGEVSPGSVAEREPYPFQRRSERALTCVPLPVPISAPPEGTLKSIG